MKLSAIIIVLFSLDALAWRPEAPVGQDHAVSAISTDLNGESKEGNRPREKEDGNEEEKRPQSKVPNYTLKVEPKNQVDYCAPIRARAPSLVESPIGSFLGKGNYFRFELRGDRVVGSWSLEYRASGEDKKNLHSRWFEFDLSDNEVRLQDAKGPQLGVTEKFYLNPEAAIALLEEISDMQVYVQDLAKMPSKNGSLLKFADDLRCLEQQIAKAAMLARRYLK